MIRIDGASEANTRDGLVDFLEEVGTIVRPIWVFDRHWYTMLGRLYLGDKLFSDFRAYRANLRRSARFEVTRDPTDPRLLDPRNYLVLEVSS
jgi:hypothetical protein